MFRSELFLYHWGRFISQMFSHSVLHIHAIDNYGSRSNVHCPAHWTWLKSFFCFLCAWSTLRSFNDNKTTLWSFFNRATQTCKQTLQICHAKIGYHFIYKHTTFLWISVPTRYPEVSNIVFPTRWRASNMTHIGQLVNDSNTDTTYVIPADLSKTKSVS